MFGKKKKRNFYDMELERLQANMQQLEPGSDKYKESQAELKTLIAIRGEDKESRRRISKTHKGEMLVKGLGITGILTAIGVMSFHERQGYSYGGENRKWIDILCNNLGRFNLFR